MKPSAKFATGNATELGEKGIPIPNRPNHSNPQWTEEFGVTTDSGNGDTFNCGNDHEYIHTVGKSGTVM